MTATTVGTTAGRPRAVAALLRPTAAYHLALGSGGLLATFLAGMFALSVRL